MASLTIRNFDEDLKSRLRVQAARHGQSMEQEVRCILREALEKPPVVTALGRRLSSRFRTVAVDLPLPARSLPRASPEWEETS